MQLNQDVYIEILKYLPLQDKLNSALICKEFYTLQKYIYKKHIITPTQNNLNSILFKKWVRYHILMEFIFQKFL